MGTAEAHSAVRCSLGADLSSFSYVATLGGQRVFTRVEIVRFGTPVAQVASASVQVLQVPKVQSRYALLDVNVIG
jgi:hypothetical protein